MYDLAVRQKLVDNLNACMRRLDEVVNRPMRNVARRTVRDDLEPLVKLLHTGPVSGTRKYFKRAIAALDLFYERPLAALRVRLSLWLAQRGTRSRRAHDELYVDLSREIMLLKIAINEGRDSALRNPPLERSLKHLIWASLEWTSERRDWQRVKDELDRARAPF